ncbi:MAG: hypothetical protein MZV63_27455 [Marinilabiliales bacterium]|nr:hypothetical protein [Marinilabiliales bacterium]
MTSEPMWIGDRIYFLSDRNGEFNLFSYDVNGGDDTSAIRTTTDFPVLKALSLHRHDSLRTGRLSSFI